jgi:probable DNA metabolism protein
MSLGAEVDNTLLDDASLVYVYDGSLEGMLTAVFEAFASRQRPVAVVSGRQLQQSLLLSYLTIDTDVALAERVRDGIINTLGEKNYGNIKQVFLSDDEHKGKVLVDYLQYTMRKGRMSCAHLANPAVAAFEDLRRQVSSEAHYMLQFVRFAQLQNGVYFSRIQPKASVVPLIMDHFASRFNIQPFIIYDASHGLSGVFDTEKWWLVDAREVGGIDLSGNSRLEDGFQSLWQTFYDTIAIEERRNPRCQRNFMPKRFWGNMCEHIPPQLRNIRPQTASPTAVARLAAKQQSECLLPAVRQ